MAIIFSTDFHSQNNNNNKKFSASYGQDTLLDTEDVISEQNRNLSLRGAEILLAAENVMLQIQLKMIDAVETKPGQRDCKFRAEMGCAVNFN